MAARKERKFLIDWAKIHPFKTFIQPFYGTYPLCTCNTCEYIKRHLGPQYYKYNASNLARKHSDTQRHWRLRILQAGPCTKYANYKQLVEEGKL